MSVPPLRDEHGAEEQGQLRGTWDNCKVALCFLKALTRMCSRDLSFLGTEILPFDTKISVIIKISTPSCGVIEHAYNDGSPHGPSCASSLPQPGRGLDDFF